MVQDRPHVGGSMYRVLMFKSRWGWMGVAESERGLAAIVLPQPSKKAVVAGLGIEAAFGEGSVTLLRAQKQLLEYLAGSRTSFHLPLDLTRGTPFQRQVWK